MTSTTTVVTLSTINTSDLPKPTSQEILDGEVLVQPHEPRNGVLRNVCATSSAMPQSSSTQNLRKKVSTVFSSNHRKSWQLSLSNYGSDPSKLHRDTDSPQNAESTELQVRRVIQADDDSPAVTLSPSQTVKPGHVHPEGHAAEVSRDVDCESEVKVKLEQSQDLTARYDDVTVKVSLSESECGSGPCSLSQRFCGVATGHVDLTASRGPAHGPRAVPDTELTWSSHREPHQLRQYPYTPSPSKQDCIELSVYHANSSPHSLSPSSDASTTDPLRQQEDQSRSTSQNRSQSVCVLRTGDQPEPFSLSSSGCRKSSDRSIRYSSDILQNEPRYSRRAQVRVHGREERAHETSMSSSDCPSDTQPLIPVPRIRIEEGSHSGSPEICVENTLVRFHSLDSKDSGSKATDAEHTPCMQRAISINTTNNLSLEASHLVVGASLGAGSPTGSDSVTAPPLNDLYRYHVFLSHCAQDTQWASEVVERLQAPPYSYKCAYTPQSLQDQTALEQSMLCSAMLSERVVLVLSKQYVKETWFLFEKILRQLTQMSLHNQRIMGVLLEDCDIPDTLGELYFLDTSDPDFFDVFTKRLKTGRIPRSSESVSSDMAGRTSVAAPSVVNGQTLAQCQLVVKVGWDSFLEVTDTSEDLPPSLKAHGINLERTEFYAIVHNVCTVLRGSNKLPWVMCVQPLLALVLAATLWLPAFIAVLALQVDDNTGLALPVRLVVFVFPLIIVSCGYLLKWRRRYWMAKMVRMLIHNCVRANQLLYCEGRPVLTTAGHVQANSFLIYFIYFDLTDCVRSVDLLLFTCLEDDWDKLMRLVEFYARDKTYLSQVSMSERLTVMTGSAYLFKLVRSALPHPPQLRHMHGHLCLCQFTEECVTRFVHALDREDVAALLDLFTRHLVGYVSGTTVRRINTELFHRLQ